MKPEMPQALDYSSAAKIAVQQLMECTANERAAPGQTGLNARTGTAVLAAWTTAMCLEMDRKVPDDDLLKALVSTAANLCASAFEQITGKPLSGDDIDHLVMLVRSRIHINSLGNMRTTSGVQVAAPKGSA